MKSPVRILPGVLDALHAVHRAIEQAGVAPATLALMNLRASQINGCGVCVDMHSRALQKLGEKDARIFAASAWREAPYYSEAERAALALTEAASRLNDRADPVPDDIWQDAARHYDETALAALVMSLGLIGLWNCVNVSTRQLGGDWVAQYV